MQASRNRPDIDQTNHDGLLPPRIGRWVMGVIGGLLLGSLYLIAVRGPAILFDLTSAVAALCF